MINSFLKFKTKILRHSPPSVEDIKDSNKILFAIFTRYGDTIIDLVVIQEFIESYPDKEYLILCPRQMTPYVNELLPDIKCLVLNKRNIFDMIKVNSLLKKRKFDVGFNPWSNGLDSCFFLTYCKKFLCYKDLDKPKIINHYQVVRRYLQLPVQNWEIRELTLKENYQKILICPQSTATDRSISADQLSEIILNFNQKYKNPEITIASMNKANCIDGCSHFYFEKTAQSSQLFIDLVKESELIVCADSAPLHVSLALNKPTIISFKTTTPEKVLNTGACVSYA